MRTITMIIAGTFLVSLAWLAPAAAQSCASTGAGDESCSSVATCNSGANLYVTANVDEDGWVKGKHFCADKTTGWCTGVRSCSGSAGSATTQSGNGMCEGEGNGGWLTVLSVTCDGSFAQPSPVQDLVRDALEAAGSPGLTPELESLLTPLTGYSIWILAVQGTPAAYACAAGAGCEPTPFLCPQTGAQWRCATL